MTLFEEPYKIMVKNNLFFNILIIFLLFISSSKCTFNPQLSSHNILRARTSCLEHYLAGEGGTFYSKEITLPLSVPHSSGDSTYFVKCKMPKSGEGYEKVETIIKNALEQWYGIRRDEERTIGYQIKDKLLIEKIFRDSNSCEQVVTIDWNEYIKAEALRMSMRDIKNERKKLNPWEEINDKLEGHEDEYIMGLIEDEEYVDENEILFELISYSGQKLGFRRRDSERG
uniref:Uncharacterized protein n=1 Tax=Parastrongyloides trichosuri TaxID=131310 RepID=A0A0N4Z2D6_PARTI